MLDLYNVVYSKLSERNPELTHQVYDDIILRGCTLPWGYISSISDLQLCSYPKDYRYYKTLNHYKAAIYEWINLKYVSLHDQYILYRLKKRFLETDEYGQLVHNYLFSTILYPDLYIPVELEINKYPVLLDKNVFEIVLSVCSELHKHKSIKYYGSILLYRILNKEYRHKNTIYTVGYKIYNSACTVYFADWVEYDGVIYDVSSIYKIYSNNTKGTAQTIGNIYATKSIKKGYYYSKMLYGEKGLIKMPTERNTVLDESTDSLLDSIVDSYLSVVNK